MDGGKICREGCQVRRMKGGGRTASVRVEETSR